MEQDISSSFDTDRLADLAAPSLRTALAFRARSLGNLLRMGHCAPALMRTFLDICGEKEAWPVKMAAGLPGGIGDTGFECGGITAPLIFFGLRHGLRASCDGLPVIFDLGQTERREAKR